MCDGGNAFIMQPFLLDWIMNIEIMLGDLRIRLGLRFPQTAGFADGFITKRDCDACDVFVPDEDIPRYPLVCTSGVLDPFSEWYMLMARTSAYLLKHDRVLLHGVSFLWEGKAWILTAPSGTGKTTQLRHWQRLYSDEIELINGDKSVLCLRENGSLWVCPSPWTGKEQDAGYSSGELGGIILLRQAASNTLRPLVPRESVRPLFSQFLMLGDTEEEVRAAGKLLDALVSKTPIWRLDNLGDEDSARLTHDSLFEVGERS